MALSYAPRAFDVVLLEADAVVEGTVVEISYEYLEDIGAITWATLAVEEVYAGEVLGTEFDVLIPGGPAPDGGWVSMPGHPGLRLDEHVILPLMSHQIRLGPGKVRMAHFGSAVLKRDSASSFGPIATNAYDDPVVTLQEGATVTAFSPELLSVWSGGSPDEETESEDPRELEAMSWAEAQGTVIHMLEAGPRDDKRVVNALDERAP